MKIKFWGTAAGLAEKDRYCTSVLIEIQDSYYILDFGAPVEHLVSRDRIELSKIKAGFITHMHPDHVDCLTSFAKLYADFTNFIYAPASVDIFMPAGIDEFKNWLNAMNLAMSERMTMTKIEEGTFYDDGTLKVTAIKTEHMKALGQPTYAFVFEAEGKKVLFTGDLTDDFHDFPIGDHYDLIVCELAHGDVKSVERCVTESDCERVIFYHMSTDPIILNKIGVDRTQTLKDASRNFDFTCEFAYDDYETEV
ncbi:MAG: ribonuclease Z [Clostridia bacterium]|nr:ribonuclease Z [Clostridia bacterium]